MTHTYDSYGYVSLGSILRDHLCNDKGFFAQLRVCVTVQKRNLLRLFKMFTNLRTTLKSVLHFFGVSSQIIRDCHVIKNMKI